jgi:O-antigen ligase
MTGSRGNAIAAAVIVIMLIWRSRYKVTALVGVALLIWPAAYVAGDRFYNRMSTLQDVEADGSARSRITFAKAAIEMALKYPIFGVGYGELNYARLHGLFGGETGYVAHNTYLQTAADSGFPALGIYIALLWGTIWWLGRSAKRMMRAMPEYRYYPYALQGSLLAFAIASTFYSRFDFEFLYFDLMAAAVWYRVERELLAAHDIKAVDDRSIKPFIPAPVAIATTEPQKAAVRQLHPGKPPR